MPGFVQARRRATAAPEPGTAGTPTRGAWRQPVVWLALAVFVAILAGCIAMIVIAVHVDDGTVPPSGAPTILKMPVERAGSATPAPR